MVGFSPDGKVNKVGTAALEQVGKRLWGFKPNLMEDIVDQHGSGTSLSWFARNMPRYERILKQWGPVRTHLVASITSAMTGCPYCTYGHAYAMELHYFSERSELMSADEREIEGWCGQEEATVVENFRRLLVDSDLESELPILERVVELRSGQESTGSDDDANIAHLLKMFEFLNSCGINAGTESDAAHDPINKNAELRTAYARRRSS